MGDCREQFGGKRAVVYIAWGNESIHYVTKSIRSLAKSGCADCATILITDDETPVPENLQETTTVVRADFAQKGRERKSEILRFLPKGFDSYLFLDADTQVLMDITLGFDKAEIHGIAMAQAPHYSLDNFWGFDRIMRLEGVQPRGELQYNTGVIFFSLTDGVMEVFDHWRELVERHAAIFPNSDQPFLTLAMEKLDFDPYVLSPSYNHRALGELISGAVRIWHSYGEVPEDLNRGEANWPPRRIENGRVVYLAYGVDAYWQAITGLLRSTIKGAADRVVGLMKRLLERALSLWKL